MKKYIYYVHKISYDIDGKWGCANETTAKYGKKLSENKTIEFDTLEQAKEYAMKDREDYDKMLVYKGFYEFIVEERVDNETICQPIYMRSYGRTTNV